MFLYHPYWLRHDHEPKALPKMDINGSQGFLIKSAVFRGLYYLNRPNL